VAGANTAQDVEAHPAGRLDGPAWMPAPSSPNAGGAGVVDGGKIRIGLKCRAARQRQESSSPISKADQGDGS
jgi:hypothetical protein